MKRYSIPREVKIDIERIIRRYPLNKQRYLTMYEDVILATHPNTDDIRGNITSENKAQSVTEGKALQLVDNPYYDRMKREVDAVESAIANLDDVKKDIIKQRYWSRPHKNTPISWIQSPYSYEAISGICRRVLYNVGRNMGLIK